MSIAVITDWKPVFDHQATGAKARALRKSKGFKSRAVSKLMGMSASHFSEIESGKRGWCMNKVRRYEEALDYLSQNAGWSDRLYDEMDDAGICTACGLKMTEVRPGKAQCDYCELGEAYDKERAEREEIAALVRRLFEILDTVEVSDSETEFHPTVIRSCRVMHTMELDELLPKLKEAAK